MVIILLALAIVVLFYIGFKVERLLDRISVIETLLRGLERDRALRRGEIENI